MSLWAGVGRLGRWGAWGGIIVALAFAPAAAQEPGKVRARGLGSIIDGDRGAARDKAIADARVKALEQAVGVYIESSALVQNELLADSVIKDKTAGFIKEYRVVEEKELPRDIYEVTIEATVVPETFKGKLKTIMSNASIIVQVSEENCQQAVAEPWTENELITLLRQEGYNVLDREQARRIQDRDRQLLALRGDAEAAGRVGLRFLSNVIVTGVVRATFGQETMGIVSARSRGNVRVIEADSAKVISNQTVPFERGFGRSCEDAGEKLLREEIAPKLARNVVQQVTEYFRKNTRTIAIELTGLPGMNAARRFEAFLRELRWVKEPKLVSFAGGLGTFSLQYPEKPVYLANGINRRPEYELVEFSGERILVRAKKK